MLLGLDLARCSLLLLCLAASWRCARTRQKSSAWVLSRQEMAPRLNATAGSPGTTGPLRPASDHLEAPDAQTQVAVDPRHIRCHSRLLGPPFAPIRPLNGSQQPLARSDSPISHATDRGARYAVAPARQCRQF